MANFFNLIKDKTLDYGKHLARAVKIWRPEFEFPRCQNCDVEENNLDRVTTPRDQPIWGRNSRCVRRKQTHENPARASRHRVVPEREWGAGVSSAWRSRCRRPARQLRRAGCITARGSTIYFILNFFDTQISLAGGLKRDCFLFFYQQQREVVVIEVELRIPC